MPWVRVSPWFRIWPNGACTHRLLCLPYAGGSAAVFAAWPAALPPCVEVVAVQLPGRLDRVGEQPFTRMMDLVDALGSQVRLFADKPLICFGHSLGAIVIFELARWLRRSGQRGPGHLFVSGRRAPQRPDDGPLLHSKSDDEFIQALEDLGGPSTALLRNTEIRELLFPALRADCELAEKYEYRPEPPLDCPVTVFGGSKDEEVLEDRLSAWQFQTKARFATHLFRGGTFLSSRMRKRVPRYIGGRRGRRLWGRFHSPVDSNGSMRSCAGARIIPAMKRLTYALRQLRCSPLFTAVAVFTLSVGIGANAAIFTLADVLLLRPLPVRDPSRLVRISAMGTEGPQQPLHATLMDVLAEQRQLFDGVCGFLALGATVEINGRIRAANTHAVTGSCFRVLGVAPAVGRLLDEEDDKTDAPAAVVLAYDEWMHSFGGDANVVGKTIRIEKTVFTIVGVAEQGFKGLQVGFPTRFFYTVGDGRNLGGPGPWPPRSMLQLEVLGRLRPGVAKEAAIAQLRVRWRGLLETSVPPEYVPAQRDQYLQLQPTVTGASTGIDYVLRPQFQTPLIALLVTSSLVLLLVCVNLATLLLSRSSERRHEQLVRAVCGASRLDLLTDSVVQSALLLSAGFAAGLAVAYGISTFLVSVYSPTMVNFAIDVKPTGRILAFTSIVSGIVLVLFAGIPAWTASKVDAAALNSASSRVVGGRQRLRTAAVIAQVAVTVVLVTLGSVFVAALRQVQNVPLGLSTDRVVIAQLAATPGGYEHGFSGGTYYRSLIAQLLIIPGVDAVAFSRPVPLSGFAGTMRVWVPESPGSADAAIVFGSDGLFSTLQIPMVAGTAFGQDDRPGGVETAVLSESLARAIFGAGSPLGKTILMGSSTQSSSRQIVGVARDAVLRAPQDANKAVLYLNYWQMPDALQVFPTLLVRASDSAGPIDRAIESAVRKGGREYISSMTSLADLRESAMTQERLLAVSATALALLGLSLAAVGLYGVLNFSVNARTTEIGTRMALGATRSQIGRLVLRDALALIATGALFGVPAAWFAARVAASRLYGQETVSGTPLLAGLALTLAVGLAAVCLPIYRATAVQPMQALRRA